MKNVWVTDCHACGQKGTVTTGRTSSDAVLSECVSCERTWAYADYVPEYKAAKGGLGPYPVSVSIPDYLVGIDPEFPGSQDFEDQITDLIGLVERQVRAETRREILDQCAAYVQHNLPSTGIREVMAYLERETKRAEDELDAS